MVALRLLCAFFYSQNWWYGYHQTIVERAAVVYALGPYSRTSYDNYIVGFWLVEMAISTNQKPTIYRNLYENTGPDTYSLEWTVLITLYIIVVCSLAA